MELIRKTPKVLTFAGLKVGEMFVFDPEVSPSARCVYTKENNDPEGNCKNLVDGGLGWASECSAVLRVEITQVKEI